MSTPHEAIAAWPVTGNADKALARAIATRRLPYSLSSAESAADLVVVDPATGVVPLYLIQNGTLFEYDSLDSTTVASAVCLVTNDSKRYKSGGITPPYSVLTVGTTAQPASPSIGDTYLIPTAATGADWAGNDGKIGIYSRAGWQFAVSPIGRGLYAEDTNIRWYRNAAGTWVSGFGGLTISANTFASAAIIGAGAAFIRKVENQTTETAPASPVAPVAYIVGAVPAGAWSAYSPGDLAICNVNGAWTRAVPEIGDKVFDKDLDISVEWDGTAWISANGALLGVEFEYTQGTGSAAFGGGSGTYAYNSSVTPTTALAHFNDNITIPYTSRAGSRLRFRYEARCLFDVAGVFTWGLFYDSVASPVMYGSIVVDSDLGLIQPFSFTRVITAPSASNLTWKVKIFVPAGTVTLTLSERYFSIEELTA